jgi:hypothetical protein
MIALAVWDALVASLAYLVLLPALAVIVSPWFLVGYVIDAPVVLTPVVIDAEGARSFRPCKLPCYFALRVVNAVMMRAAFTRECVLRRPLLVYEKGH